ncbi:hypothetical protein BV20DRAFT_205537 [Pilatotrama ljubarskyi]|nr:hypothetical protein BV20DRAFT_205537 [Pilatotrama ljubarskyi]
MDPHMPPLQRYPRDHDDFALPVVDADLEMIYAAAPRFGNVELPPDDGPSAYLEERHSSLLVEYPSLLDGLGLTDAASDASDTDDDPESPEGGEDPEDDWRSSATVTPRNSPVPQSAGALSTPHGAGLLEERASRPPAGPSRMNAWTQMNARLERGPAVSPSEGRPQGPMRGGGFHLSIACQDTHSFVWEKGEEPKVAWVRDALKTLPDASKECYEVPVCLVLESHLARWPLSLFKPREVRMNVRLCESRSLAAAAAPAQEEEQSSRHSRAHRGGLGLQAEVEDFPLVYVMPKSHAGAGANDDVGECVWHKHEETRRGDGGLRLLPVWRSYLSIRLWKHEIIARGGSQVRCEAMVVLKRRNPRDSEDARGSGRAPRGVSSAMGDMERAREPETAIEVWADPIVITVDAAPSLP